MMENEQTASATTHGHVTVAMVLLFPYHAWLPGKDENT